MPDERSQQAMDCSSFLLANMKPLMDGNATLGLAQPLDAEQWAQVATSGCSAVWMPAYCGQVLMGDMFLVDQSDAVRHDISGKLLFHDIGLAGGIFSARENWRPDEDWCNKYWPQ